MAKVTETIGEPIRFQVRTKRYVHCEEVLDLGNAPMFADGRQVGLASRLVKSWDEEEYKYGRKWVRNPMPFTGEPGPYFGMKDLHLVTAEIDQEFAFAAWQDAKFISLDIHRDTGQTIHIKGSIATFTVNSQGEGKIAVIEMTVDPPQK